MYVYLIKDDLNELADVYRIHDFKGFGSRFLCRAGLVGSAIASTSAPLELRISCAACDARSEAFLGQECFDAPRSGLFSSFSRLLKAFPPRFKAFFDAFCFADAKKSLRKTAKVGDLDPDAAPAGARFSAAAALTEVPGFPTERAVQLTTAPRYVVIFYILYIYMYILCCIYIYIY